MLDALDSTQQHAAASRQGSNNAKSSSAKSSSKRQPHPQLLTTLANAAAIPTLEHRTEVELAIQVVARLGVQPAHIVL